MLGGFVAEEDVQVWLNFAAALGFGSAGLAAPNTPPKGDKPLPREPVEGGPLQARTHRSTMRTVHWTPVWWAGLF